MPSTIVSRTQSGAESAAGRRTWTFSCWFKKDRGNGSGVNLFQADSNGAATNNYNVIDFNSSDQLDFSGYESGATFRKITNRKFRDTNAWYHLVIAFDTTQSTADDRIKIYINGVRETSFGTSTNPAQDYQGKVNAQNKVHAFGRSTSSYQWGGVLSHVHLTEGTAYAPTVFGSTDATTGEWKINPSPSVSYGTNGFFLFKDDNSVNNQAGNSSGNFAVTAGTLTKTEDCPSNVFCTINPLSNKINFSLANGNTTLNDNGSDDNDNGIVGSMGVNTGKYYWEMKKGSGSGGVHAIITEDVDVRLGNRATSSPDSQLWGFQSNGTGSPLVSYIAGTFDSSGNALQGWGANDIIGFALDMDNGKLYVSINGTFKGLNNYTSDPANATNPAITGIPTGGKFIFPYFEKRSADSPETMCNFGNGYFGTTAVSSNSGNGYSASGSLGIFQYQPPSGYTALCTKGLNE